MKQKHLQLTQKAQWNIKSGFSLVEVILAISIFGLFVTIFSGAWLYGQETTAAAGKRARAVFLAEEGLEATRNIRDENFSNLVDGVYGLVFSGGQWNLSGSFDTSDIYTRQIIISTVNSDRKQVSTQVSWQQTPQRTGSVVLVTYLTNWQAPVYLDDTTCAGNCIILNYADGICRANANQCAQNGETIEPGLGKFCTTQGAHVCCCIGAPVADTIAPAAIMDLGLSNPSTSSIDLAWTAPGDDGTVGTATSYDIRYSNALITEANWGVATQVAGEPIPALAGVGESVTIAGLNQSTTYYFAIKTSDEVPNISTLSNVPSLSTLSSAQAGYLVVNITGAILQNNNRNIAGITLQNSGPTNITIASMVVSWSGVNNNRRLTGITIDGVSRWTGSATSGTTENISDVLMTPGSAIMPLLLLYSNAVNGINLSITFTMTDGSTKTVSGIQL